MGIEDIDPVAMIIGLCGGLLGVFVAGSMMPSFLIKIFVFIASTIVGYIMASTILNH